MTDQYEPIPIRPAPFPGEEPALALVEEVDDAYAAHESLIAELEAADADAAMTGTAYADVTTRHFAEEFGVVEEPPPTLPGRFRIYSESELGNYPRTEWFEGLHGVIPQRELIGLWGPGDSFKSFVALDWSCHLAHAGLDVLYIAAEGISGLRNRVDAWKKYHGVESLPHLRIEPIPVRMHIPADVVNFVACVTAQMPKPALVVVDTLARNFVGGNENSADDNGLFVAGAEHIRTTLGATVLVVHHSTVDGSKERGGESVRNASFAMYRFERVGARKVIVSCDRMKDAEPPPAVTIRPVVVELGQDENGLDISSLVAQWPYGDSPVEFADDDAARSKRVQMMTDITEVVKAWGSNGDRLSQTQIVKRVKGRNETIATLLKELTLDASSPVQSKKSMNSDGSPGKSIDYFYDVTAYTILPDSD